mmetsp:Transcript_19668/g.42760  ORF Transcript_19668/g.42760 Transcript_19668/m.42760 type:complete len:125 (-) Transcript_19668:834-1208(-)
MTWRCRKKQEIEDESKRRSEAMVCTSDTEAHHSVIIVKQGKCLFEKSFYYFNITAAHHCSESQPEVIQPHAGLSLILKSSVPITGSGMRTRVDLSAGQIVLIEPPIVSAVSGNEIIFNANKTEV